jgi:hypothetical protein
MIEALRRQWCRSFHKEVLRPVRGKYICASCLREWPVHWHAEESPKRSARRSQSIALVGGERLTTPT